MSLAHLPTLAEMQAQRRATPKGELRVLTKAKAQKDDKKQLDAFKAAVWKRDEGKCRVCGKKVKKTLALDPKRGEVHHLVSRAAKHLRHDPRNGVLVCYLDHQAIEHNDVHVRGSASQMFEASGKSYLNADCPLQFVRKE